MEYLSNKEAPDSSLFDEISSFINCFVQFKVPNFLIRERRPERVHKRVIENTKVEIPSHPKQVIQTE